MIQIDGGDVVAPGLTNEMMISRLKRSGTLTSPAVEKAMLIIPRGEFVTDDIREAAYIGTKLD